MKIAGTEAVSHTYGDRNGQLLKSTYANGWEVAYTYDSFFMLLLLSYSKLLVFFALSVALTMLPSSS